MQGFLGRHLMRLIPKKAVDYDENGNVLAFAGLSLNETVHQLTMESKVLYTWCGFDSLFIPLLLGKDAEISTISPNDERVSFSLKKGEFQGSEDIVMSLVSVSASAMREDVRVVFCHNVNFFPNIESGTRYIEQHDDLTLVSIKEALKLAHRWNEVLFSYHKVT